ncbi:hypothetical protein [Nannocystis radixulma]|uniref:Uncharacterized protein n=1 Tax=Nannocystis radixulma TaxID=2995305 RepID=A0ABT5AX40_9BACT|nr:hypothetical protein [Nannocystis radixulma]MDC0666406.1 hypothetical protein [Nannocystis radixulma]
MLRNILMVCSVLAVSTLVSTPAQAGPARWEPLQQLDQNLDQDLDTAVLLNACVQTQIFVGTGTDNRSYDCDTLTGPACLAQCAENATCRSQCEDGGALFCAPSDLVARLGGWDDPFFNIDPWDHDDIKPDVIVPDIEEVVFIDTSTCLQLDLAG